MKDSTPAEMTQVCSVHLGNALFGIPIRHILEIVGGARPQNVPLAADFVGGLMHYRGDVLTTVSLRRLLDLPCREGPQDLLVVEGSEGAFGLLVDAVRDVLTVSAADFESNPSTMCKQWQTLFAGAFKLKDALMVMLDPERLQPTRLISSVAAEQEPRCDS